MNQFGLVAFATHVPTTVRVWYKKLVTSHANLITVKSYARHSDTTSYWYP